MSDNNENIKLIKIFLVKTILLVGQKTYFGRGGLRKILILFINKLLGKGKIGISRFICTVNKVPFKFYNDELTGIKFYFGRNENYEINFLKKNSEHNSVFIDIGSNMGLYTQNIANLINDDRKIKIIAIDANPIVCDRLNANLSLLENNKKKYVKIINCALGNHNSIIKLDYSKGLANGTISNKESKKFFKIQCKKLISILNEENIKFITNLKIDIEGYEDRALIPFFKNRNKNLFPKNIILEHSSKNQWKINLISYLNKIGYKEIFKNNANLILSLNNNK